MDQGHKQTDDMLKDLEKRIQKVYGQAARETQQKVTQYYSGYADRYNKKVADLNDGKITKDEFQSWCRSNMLTGQRWQELKDTLSQDMANADKLAMSMVNGHLPEVYALNHNYGTYEAEKGAMVNTSYSLYDRQTVERLIRDDPKLIPHPKLDRNKDIRWNKNKFNEGITQGILQGESLRDIAKRVALGTANSDYKAAVRNARTATTGAENAGRIDSYERAEKMGIKVKKVWMATLDNHTRDSHALLDGEAVDYDQPFSNGLMFPADPDGNDPAEIWNCRCTLIADVDGSVDMSDLSWRNDDHLGGMSYDEWKEAHRVQETDTQNTKDIEYDSNQPVGDMSIDPSNTRKSLEYDHVEHRPVERYDTMPTESEIIDRLGGGDLTTGSCASLAMAYAGNKNGMNVLDFRGGKSQATFSRALRLNEIAQLPGVQGVVTKNFNDFSAAHELLGHVQPGKEYCLGVGRHMAVVKKVGDGFQYLELQSAFSNGWKDLDDRVLKNRFGCCRSHTIARQKVELSSELMEVNSLAQNKEFQNLLGYINTAETSQKKGVRGYVR